MARILVIDDSPVMRNLLEEFLSDNGHTVVCADDGEAGIREGRQNSYDVIICDIHMPKKNGLQVYRDLSAELPGAQFILTDSMPDELSTSVTKNLPVRYLRKPFELTQLNRVMAQLLVSSNER